MLPAARYQQTQTSTASPERILVLLLQRARRDMAATDEHLARGAAAAAQSTAQHAIDIVSELLSTLDRGRAPALVDQLTDVYSFVLAQLFRAAAGDRRALHDAQRAFAPVAEAFEEAARSLVPTAQATPAVALVGARR